MATIATRVWRASGWSSSQYIQFKWVASTSNRTASSVKVSVTLSCKAYGVAKIDLVAVGGNATMSCTVGGTSFAATSVSVANLVNTQSETITKTISVSSSATTLSTTTRVAGDNVSLAVTSGTSVSVSAYVPPSSTPSWSGDAKMGTALAVNTNGASGRTHSMSLAWNGNTLWSATNVGASTSINVPTSYASQIPNNMYLTATLTTATYSGDTLIGTVTQSMKVYVPDYSISCSVTATPYNNDMPLTTYTKYLQGYSKASLTATWSTSGWYSATLVSITANGVDISSGSGRTDFLTSNIINIQMVDSRGKSYTNHITLSNYETYQAPSLSAYELTRTTASSKTVLSANIVGSYKNLDNLNTPTLTAKYSTDANVTPTLTYANGNITGCANIVRPSGSYPDTTFNITLTLSDTMGSSVSYNLTINTLEVPLDLQQYGAGIGALATNGTSATPIFEIAWTTLLKGNKLGFTQKGDWYYWKADGLTIAMATLIVSCGSSTASGSVYRCAFSTTIPSGIFTFAPKIVGNVSESAQAFAVNGQASTPTAVSGYVFRGNSSSGFNSQITLIAIGV